MKYHMPGIMIAAAGSGCGKTTITCALLQALKNRGMRGCAFKCGPDYIDPMFHKKVIGVPSHNLDSFFSEREQLLDIYTRNMEGNEIAVIEGAMGLFDGLGGISEEGSAYQVASVLRLPVLLVVDAYGMGRSIIPLLAGFQQYDKEKRIVGVILNKISGNFYKNIAPVIEDELKLAVFGYLPKKQELVLGSRHLGLKLPEEIQDLQKQIQCAAEVLEENISIDKVLEAARRAENLETTEPKKQKISGDIQNKGKEIVRIGIARDEAFCFYYEENLRALKQNGAELISFSPLHDKALPENLDGILLGGGYPELYAQELEKNSPMRALIRKEIASGMPSLAECGGFMYLHETLKDDKGVSYAMCGVLPGKCFYTGRLVRFGYVEVQEKNATFLKEGTIVKGHEFHYYESENNGQDCIVRKPVAGAGNQSWDCIYSGQNHFWGFPHMYYPSNPDFAVHFTDEARAFKAINNSKSQCSGRVKADKGV